MYVMGSHGRFLSKVRTDTHGKLLVEKVPLQMGQGWSKVERGGRQESSLGEGAGIGRDTRRAPRPCAVMGQSQGFVADAGRKGISAPS